MSMRGVASVASLRLLAAVGLPASLALGACSAAPVAAVACEAGLVAGDLVITEVFADPDGADEGREWFELFNATDRAVELAGVTVTSRKVDGSRARSHVIGGAQAAVGGYLVLGSALPELAPAYMGYGYGAELGELFNGEGVLAVSCGGAELDAVRYQSVESGRSRAFDGGAAPDYVANDDGNQWCASAALAFEAGSFGTPGQRNDDCEVIVPGRCLDATGQRDTVAAAPGDLVITELMPNPEQVADALGEWIELWVAREVDLNGLGIDRAGDSAASQVVASERCLRVAAGSFAILARSADPALNGGLPRVDGRLPLALVSGSAAAPGDVQLLAGGALIDAVRWSRSTAGKAIQLDPDYRDVVANDEERVWCNAAAPYGDGDQGSPGEANADCTISPPAGMCQDASSFRPIRRPAPGQLVLTELMANPAGVDSEQEWFELTNVGSTSFDLNGLGLDRAGDTIAPAVILSTACKPVSPGAYAVLARSVEAARNGGLLRVDVTYGLSFGDAGNLHVLDGTTTLDAITWSDAPSDAATQLDRAFTSAAANDDEARFCAATAAYGDGRNRGTPGQPNGRCP